jgi:hypothetical protein
MIIIIIIVIIVIILIIQNSCSNPNLPMDSHPQLIVQQQPNFTVFSRKKLAPTF